MAQFLSAMGVTSPRAGGLRAVTPPASTISRAPVATAPIVKAPIAPVAPVRAPIAAPIAAPVRAPIAVMPIRTPAAPVATPAAPVATPAAPIATPAMPISNLRRAIPLNPTLAPSSGGVVQSQPAGPPPSGAPPSMSLSQSSDPLIPATPAASVISVGQFSIPQGWLVLAGVAVIVYLIASRS
jgi:hypothetical protein